MSRHLSTCRLYVSAFALSAAMACSAATPLAPAPPAGSSGGANGVTLKVGAPTPVSPINDTVLTTQTATLTISAATGQFANQTFTYDFEVQNDSGSVISTTNVNGTSFTIPGTLSINQAFRWRARANLNGAVGPYSSLVRFQTPRLVTPTAADNDNTWRTWFFQLVDLRGVGSTMTVQALQALDPDFKAAGVLQETNSGGQPRGRIYLPTGNPNNKFGRTVNLGNFGGPWNWVSMGGSTCEGGSC